MTDQPPTVVNPEAVGDPNQTPIVRLWPSSADHLTADLDHAAHRKAVRIVAAQKRGKRLGLLMLCAAPDCHGAEVFAPGHSVADVLAAADRHIAETENADA